MGFDLYISCSIRVCHETGKLFFYRNDLTKDYTIPAIVVPEEYRRFIKQRGYHLRLYTSRVTDDLSTSVENFLDKFPDWSDIWEDDDYEKIYKKTTDENIKNFNGYISEKIIDSMRAGCIPIYKGPKNIKDYIPENSFIDAGKFYSIDKLILYLENITTSRIRKYQYNISKFLTTEAPKHFSLRNFSKKILHIVKL